MYTIGNDVYGIYVFTLGLHCTCLCYKHVNTYVLGTQCNVRPILFMMILPIILVDHIFVLLHEIYLDSRLSLFSLLKAFKVIDCVSLSTTFNNVAIQNM